MRRGPLLVAFFLAALTLRPQLVGVGPLLPSIQDDLDVTHAVAGLLGTIPVLCMGLFAPPAPFLSGRVGSRLAIGAALGLIGVFGVIRALAPGAGGWRTPLLLFGVVSTMLAGLWLWLTRSELPHERVAARPLKLPWRRPLAWRLVAAFFLMSSVFYGLNAWLPDAYVERGWSESSAGGLLAVLN